MDLRNAKVSHLPHSCRWEVYQRGMLVNPSALRSGLSRVFPSCPLGSARVLALQEEVEKMLQKGALEVVDQPGTGIYSRFLF